MMPSNKSDCEAPVSRKRVVSIRGDFAVSDINLSVMKEKFFSQVTIIHIQS